MSCYTYSEYINFNKAEFFTAIFLPDEKGKFPTVIYRSPYVKHTVGMTESEAIQAFYPVARTWMDHGYAVVFQHCRGQGKSTGAFVPYVHEREDGLALREWIRGQSFYNGELFLCGASYEASLHYTTAPFESDVKGAVLEVQDSERYRLWYRNGQMRKGHANWHFGLYKDKCGLNKNFDMRSFSELPLLGLSERALGDRADDFEEMLAAESPEHEFWQTRNGGADAKDSISDTDIPILLTTGYNDFYVGGVFKMWERMSESTRKNCALLVSPYNHGDGYDGQNGLAFKNGRRHENFGDYRIAWCDNIRKGSKLPFEKGVITYYRAFEDGWQSDFYSAPTEQLTLALGDKVLSFTYDPTNPPAFRPEGLMAEDFSGRDDVVNICTPILDKDVFVKGRIKLRLAVESSCPDTAFYVRISIKREEYTYVLRHDVTSLCYQLGDYEPNSVVPLDFRFDEYAFLLKKGEQLRIDIASADDNTYVCHTNRKGEYYLQESVQTALNKVYLGQSFIALPIERQNWKTD